jgi:RNA polymerase sigma-70 factor (ECF subfamily)
MDDASFKVFSGYQMRYDLDLKQRSDEELAQKARYRSEAFAELYQRNLKAVYRYHLSRVGNVYDAQDLTAKTFLAAQEAIAMNFFKPFF